MANIPGEIVWQANDNTWFTNNAAEVYPAGITIYHVDGRYKFTDGVTTLSALPFRGDSSSSGVQSVTGSNVDNTDPANPVVNPLGLIKIIDLNGDFFTDLATATAYIEQFITPSVITDKSFNEGIFFFTVPNSTAINGYFLIDNITPSITFASLIDRFSLLDLTNAQEFGYMNAGHHIIGDGYFSYSAFNFFTGSVEMNSLFITASGGNFAESSTGKFIIKGSIGISETANFGANFFLSSTATINANASKYTSNAGGIQGDLVTAITNGCNVQFDGIDKAPIASPTFTGTVTTPAIIVSSETASRVAIFDGSKNVKSADTTTYPSLTELSYGKGVTSAIQTQLDNKGTFQSKYSGKYKTIPFSGIPASISGWLGNIFYIPIPIGETQTFTAIRQEVTVAVAASNIRLAVYSDNNGLPDSRLDDSGNLSSATTGAKDYTLSSPITVNASSKQIWVAIQVSSNVLQLRYILNSICLNYLNGSGIQTALYTQAQAFGAFPATATPVIYSNANAPLVSLLMQ